VLCHLVRPTSIIQNIQTTKEEQADKHALKEITKITKETEKKHKLKQAECDHVENADKK
jgi:hypothetical protein